MNSNYTLKDFAILVVLFVLAVCLTSCSTSHSLERVKLDYQLDQLWSEYEYKADSILIQYNKSRRDFPN